MNYRMPDFSRLMDGKIVLLAGTKGLLCSQIASLFEEHGAKVCCVYRRGMDGRDDSCIDFSKPEDIHAEVHRILTGEKRIDSLLFCMEPVRYIDAENMKQEEALAFTQGNLLAAHAFVQRVLPSMKEHCEGTIVGITSDYAVSSVPGVAMYSANAAGIQSYFRSIGIEYCKYGIRSNCVMPGFNTGDNGEAYRKMYGEEATEDAFVRFQPIERRGSCKEVANVALFCASAMSTFIQGENFPVNGGAMVVGHSQVWNVKDRPAYTHMYKKEGR